MSTDTIAKRPGAARFVLPLAVFSLLVVMLGVGLTLDPREVPSPLVGKPAQQFELTQLADSEKTF